VHQNAEGVQANADSAGKTSTEEVMVLIAAAEAKHGELKDKQDELKDKQEELKDKFKEDLHELKDDLKSKIKENSEDLKQCREVAEAAKNLAEAATAAEGDNEVSDAQVAAEVQGLKSKVEALEGLLQVHSGDSDNLEARVAGMEGVVESLQLQQKSDDDREHMAGEELEEKFTTALTEMGSHLLSKAEFEEKVDAKVLLLQGAIDVSIQEGKDSHARVEELSAYVSQVQDNITEKLTDGISSLEAASSEVKKESEANADALQELTSLVQEHHDKLEGLAIDTLATELEELQEVVNHHTEMLDDLGHKGDKSSSDSD